MTKEEVREELIGIKRGYHVKHEQIIFQALNELKEPYKSRITEYYINNASLDVLCLEKNFGKTVYMTLINESIVALEIKLQEWGA